MQEKGPKATTTSSTALGTHARDFEHLEAGARAWGDPRPKSGALGAQILKFSKECHGTLLRIFCQYPQKCQKPRRSEPRSNAQMAFVR